MHPRPIRFESNEVNIGSLPPLARVSDFVTSPQKENVVNVSLTCVRTWYRMKALWST